MSAATVVVGWDAAPVGADPIVVAARFREPAAMDDDNAKRAIALFRLGVLGPLVSARLEHGDRTAYFIEFLNASRRGRGARFRLSSEAEDA